MKSLEKQVLKWRPIWRDPDAQYPCARWSHSSCLIANNHLLIYGGYANHTYLGDIWVYNYKSMEWAELKTTGDIPTPRSGASLEYDIINNRCILFGGRTLETKLMNEVYELNMNNKKWKRIFPYITAELLFDNQKLGEEPELQLISPSKRSYHSSSLLYPYLIVFGGSSIDQQKLIHIQQNEKNQLENIKKSSGNSWTKKINAFFSDRKQKSIPMQDLNDLWAFNLITYQWKQVKFQPHKIVPQKRRFHSCCIIEGVFFVIGGCQGEEYQSFGDVYSINLLEIRKKNRNMDNLQWKKENLKGDTELLNKWGVVTAVCQEQQKIYVYGGRKNKENIDSDELVCIDLKQHKVSGMGIKKAPIGRRKPSLELINKTLYMFGGHSYVKGFQNDFYSIRIDEKSPQKKEKKIRKAPLSKL